MDDRRTTAKTTGGRQQVVGGVGNMPTAINRPAQACQDRVVDQSRPAQRVHQIEFDLHPTVSS